MTVDDWRARYDHLNAEADRLRAEVERLREEADKLRVLLATSNANCAFCGLPAAEMAKCASGFPGCSRADDMILCVHPTRQDLLDEVERLREHQERARWCEEMRADVKFSLVSTRWHVSWVTSGDYHAVNHTDRNAAIDAARGGGEVMEQPKARLTLQQSQQAINEAIWIDASPHEWPTVDKM